MHIIIVGCGKIGSTLTASLSNEGHDLTVIDTEENYLQNVANANDVIGVQGNGASLAVLTEAGIETADLLIATTGSDELNLLCCLIAKKAGKKISTIARVRNPVYREEIGYIKEELGLSLILNPEYTAATEIARILRFPSAIKIDTLAKGRVELLKFKIAADSPLAGMSLMDVNKIFKCDVLICAIERADNVIIPNGSTILAAGDTASMIASPKNASAFFRQIHVVTNQVKDTMIIGGGKIAYYLAAQLLSMGIGVKLIEKDRQRCEELDEELEGATVICADGSEQSLLMEEGLSVTESVVCLTNMDEENILLALFTKKVNKHAKAIAKVNREMFDSVMRELDVGSIIHPRSVMADYVTSYVRSMQNTIGSNVETLINIIEDKAEALEFRVREKSSVTGKPLEELELKDNLLIACIMRGKNIMYPRGRDVIEVGDTVIVVTTNKGLDDLKDILKNGGRE